MKATPLFLAAICAAIFCFPASADIKIEGMHIYSEKKDADDVECKLSRESTIAAAQAVLRANQIPILGANRTADDMDGYVNFTAMPLTQTTCAVNVHFQVLLPGSAMYKKQGKFISRDMELCSKGGILSGARVGLQNRVNDMVKTLVEMCISRVEKLGK